VRSVLGQAGVLLSARVVAAAGTGALTIVLARALGTERYGDYALALALAAVAGIVADLGIGASTARFVAEIRNDDRRSRTTVLRAARLKIVFALVVFGLFWSLADPIASLVGNADLAPLLRVAGLALFLQDGFTFVSRSLEGLRRAEGSAAMAILKSLVEIVGVVALLAVGLGAAGALLGNALGYLVALVAGGAFLWRTSGAGRPDDGDRAQGPTARTVLGYGAHIWLAGVAWLLFERIDLVALGVMRSADAVALYDAPWRLAAVTALLALALAAVVGPRLAHRDRDAAGRLLGTTLRLSLVVYMVGAAVLVVIAEPLVTGLLGSEFEESAGVVRLLAPFLVLMGVAPLLSNALDYLGEARARKWLAGGAVLVNLVLDIALIPVLGVLGPAVATDVAVLLYVAGLSVLVARRLDVGGAGLARGAGRGALAAVGAATVAAAVVWGLDAGALVTALAGGAAGCGAGLALLVGLRELRLDELRHLADPAYAEPAHARPVAT
jgi:O-antigen/teichoic acid export membrane protein